MFSVKGANASGGALAKSNIMNYLYDPGVRLEILTSPEILASGSQMSVFQA